jgi:hypothetical protein
MSAVSAYLRELTAAARDGWNRFWFVPETPESLALIRICAGLMILYTHAVWSLDLDGFFGPESRISTEFASSFHESVFAWSFWPWLTSSAARWAVHLAGLVVVGLMTVGLWTRVTSILTFLLTVAYVHALPGTLFGLDQINVMLAMYLMVGDCGGAYSMDHWLAHRREAARAIPLEACVSTRIAIRLIQLHMCVIYLFAGLGKLQGMSWWDGQAIWLAVANYEYQSIDVTWLAGWPLLVNALTHLTVAFELSYSALIWPRLTRPLVLALAVPLHLGIAACLGMMTFGLIMLVGNLAFVSPWLVRQLVGSLAGRGRRVAAGQPTA